MLDIEIIFEAKASGRMYKVLMLMSAAEMGGLQIKYIDSPWNKGVPIFSSPMID